MAEQYGRRLMVGVLEEEAQHHPERIFALIPESSDLQDGFRQVTFQQVKAAVDHTVYWLQAEFGPFALHETLSYVGVLDLRYNILFYAALKLRLKVFLPSPRNPPAVNASLLEQTQCTKLVYSPEMAPMVQKLQESVSSLHCLQFAALDELLTAQSLSVPYPLNLDQVRRDPILILHSSGSTGIPKPVTMTHGTFATIDNDRNFPSIPGRRNHDLSTWDFRPGSCLYAPFPPFHFAGFCNSILVPVFTKTIPVLGPPNRLPSAGLVAQILRSQDVQGCLLPPSIAAALYEEPDGPDLLKGLDVLCYAGGPLPEAIGNELVKHVTLCQFYGSTEVGPVRQLHPLKQHWQFMEFHPQGNYELQPAEDDAFELVVYTNEETEEYSALNHNFPGIREYRTKDLFRQHPTEPGLWKFHARRDDIVVLSSGEKFNPVPTELGLEAVPGVAGALIAGQGRPQVALLVELQPDHGLGPNPVEGLWPWVTKLNANTSGPGRILKSMILIANPKKPLVRAGKGTVVRKLTLAAYETELNAVFEGSPTQRVQPRVLKPTAFHLDSVKSLVHSIAEDALDGQHVNDAENLYTQGLDSVKSLEIIAQLKESLNSHRPEEPLSWLVPEILYNYPTVDELSTVLTQWLNTGAHPKQMDRVAKMRDLFSRYEASLPTSSVSSQPYNRGETLNVILIGSTGYLGQYLLMSLSQDPSVGRIFCLNRSATAHEQWAANASTKGEGWQNKISFFQADFTKPAFGIQDDAYEELKECDVILHSAWQVNFALPLDAFTDSISGLLNSIQLAASSKRRTRLLFISSIAATGVFAPPGSPNKKVVLKTQ
jgi:acyl-coenzyme A synthetase/AMP-(fatty) acid ligase/acyl carrier protein